MALRHANAIHPPATFNQTISRDILFELITNPLVYDATAASMTMSYFIDSITSHFKKLSVAGANRLHTLMHYLYKYYKQFLLLHEAEVGLYNIDKKAMLKVRTDRIALQIFNQENAPTKYQTISILDGFLCVALINKQSIHQLLPRLPVKIQNYFQEVLSAGYVVSYYEIINPENIYVKAMRGQLQLTPQTFEQAATYKLEDYEQTIRDLLKSPSQRERKPTIRDPLNNKKAFKIEGESETEINRTFPSSNPNRIGETRYGWSKKKLLDAIHTFHQDDGPVAFMKNALVEEPGNIRRYYIPYYRMDLNGVIPTPKIIRHLTLINRFVTDFSLGLEEPVFSYEFIREEFDDHMAEISRSDPTSIFLNITKEDIRFYADNAWKIMPLPGIQRNPYRKGIENVKIYYEYLYRHLNLTTTYYKWQDICQRTSPPESLIRNLAIYDHGIRENLPLRSLCTILRTRPITQLQTNVRTEISENAEALIRQPGSVLVESERQTEFGKTPGAEYMEPAYRQVYNLCAQLEKYSKYDLLQLAHEMGIARLINIDLREKTKEEICAILTNYVRQYRQAKQLL